MGTASNRPAIGFYAKTFGAVFLVSFLVGLVTIAILARPRRVEAIPRQDAVTLKPLTPGLVVTSQLLPGDLIGLRERGVRAVIDLRPDGEAPDQPTARAMADAAQAQGLSFFYTPTPHGVVPAEVVHDFSAALAFVRAKAPVSPDASQAPVALFCRSGARAVRVRALAEASRASGMSLDQIERAAMGAGFSIADERDEIVRRIAARGWRSRIVRMNRESEWGATRGRVTVGAKHSGG